MIERVEVYGTMAGANAARDALARGQPSRRARVEERTFRHPYRGRVLVYLLLVFPRAIAAGAQGELPFTAGGDQRG